MIAGSEVRVYDFLNGENHTTFIYADLDIIPENDGVRIKAIND